MSPPYSFSLVSPPYSFSMARLDTIRVAAAAARPSRTALSNAAALIRPNTSASDIMHKKKQFSLFSFFLYFSVKFCSEYILQPRIKGFLCGKS